MACRILLPVFAGAYVLALLGWGAGIFSLFGSASDPLSAIGLVLLGQPWVRWVDSLPEAMWPAATALAPAINAALLALLCRRSRATATRSADPNG